jgi:hypothetical protein
MLNSSGRKLLRLTGIGSVILLKSVGAPMLGLLRDVNGLFKVDKLELLDWGDLTVGACLNQVLCRLW